MFSRIFFVWAGKCNWYLMILLLLTSFIKASRRNETSSVHMSGPPCYMSSVHMNISQEGTVTNPAIWLVLSAVRIFLSLTTVTVTARNSTGEIVLLVNFRVWTSGNRQPLPFLHFHRRLINASLPLFTLKWQGMSLNSIDYFEVARVCLVVRGSAL